MATTKVKRTRNAGTWTEAAYWSRVRSALRRCFRYWKPAIDCKMASRRPYKGKGRAKWEYQCNHCKQWFFDKDVQIDHITPVGSLRSSADLVGFLERLTPERGFQVLCKECHKKKTDEERRKIDA